jgi:hypothetical protein
VKRQRAGKRSQNDDQAVPAVCSSSRPCSSSF